MGTTAKSGRKNTWGGGGIKPTITKYQKLEPLLIDYSESFLAVLPLSVNHKVNFE